MHPPEPDLKAIFAAALDHPAGPERSAYLDAACGAAGPLRLQVDALLRAHEGAGHFLDSAADPGDPTAAADFVLAPGPGTLDFTPAPPGATRTAPDPAAPRPDLGPAEGLGAVIGPYKLLQAIGKGGMGTVFMAEQDRPIRRKVALKVIRAGMDTRRVVARFEAERQALALMDHPNIARVLDAGATATGRPYFVMELVRGVPITEYCDRNHLTPRERLELFLPVCRAIQHAHQKGIIHRDIKPTNVLVTLHDGRPEPKVIDFGVAKAIEQRLTQRTMSTEFGAIVGTLEYMSPEQAEMGALDIDTRSDIYSLGVLLYELLTGSTPLDRARLRRAAYSEILRRIREEEPQKPSTKLSESKDALPSISAQRKTEPARLPGLMRGDLDWIVMKSLDKDRTRRYETANGFARDIRRHLDGDAVEASPPSARYRLGILARKHRVALGTAAAFAVLLILATITSAGLAFWANKERLRATKAERAALAQLDRARKAEASEKSSANTVRETLMGKPESFLRRLRDENLAEISRLVEVLAGAEPRDEAERLKMAYRAYRQGWPVGAVRLFAIAFASDPKLVSDRRTRHAYHAARAAVLACFGTNEDEMPPHEAARVELRRKALGWLRADLAEWVHILDGGPPEATVEVVEAMISWRKDPDLGNIRIPAELRRLPEAERVDFARLWADVSALLARARARTEAPNSPTAAATP